MDVRQSTKQITVVGIALLLGGCTWLFEKPKPEIIRVEIPVPGKCEIKERPEEPIYSVDHLTQDDKGNFKKIGRAYVKSLKQCRGYTEKQDNILDALEEKE